MAEAEIVICLHCGTANRVPAARLGDAPKCGKCGKALFGGPPGDIDVAGFDRLMRTGTLPVLVDFWATWCGPCRMMAPQFASAAGVLEPRVRLAKVDIDREQGLAQRIHVQSVPTLALFRGGRELGRQAGLIDRAAIVRWTQSRLPAG